MKQIVAVALVAALSTSLSATPPQTQGTTAGSTTKRSTTARKRASTSTSSAAAMGSVTTELQQMKAALDAQQRQIEQLRQDLAAKDQAIRQAQQQAQQAQQLARDAQGRAETVATTSSTNDQTISALKSDVADMKLNATNNALTMQEAQKAINESPTTIRYKGITLTPGGFLAAETVWHQHGMTSEINTPFNAIPLLGNGQYHQSEFFASGRPSRVTLLGEGSLSNVKFTGYYEMDFNSAGVTSNNNQSNSYTFRQRQVWGQAALTNGWSFTGGQMWSLVTETRNGLDNRTETPPSVIDHAYNVGFTWSRQFGFRTVKNFNNKVWLGFSVENAQMLLTAHGNLSNFVIGNAGTPGGLYNSLANYSFNISPDYVVKAAFQPKFGGHYEIFGIIRPFRDRIYPNVTTSAATSSAAGASNDSKIGGGIGANARWLFYKKHLEFGIHGFGGDGVGRYGASGLPDATVRQDGTLALLHAYQGLGTFEIHYPKVDVYFNGGGEYVSRYWQTRAPGLTPVGYGSQLFTNAGCLIETVPAGGNGFTPGVAANCTNDTKSLFEYTAGFYYKFYNGPKGRIQWGPQFSHIIRNVWTGIGGNPRAEQNMVLTSFRYYLP